VVKKKMLSIISPTRDTSNEKEKRVLYVKNLGEERLTRERKL